MNEDKESLLESFQDSSPEAPTEVQPELPAAEQPLDADMSAMADALLRADISPGGDNSDFLAENSEPSLGDLPAPDENPDPASAVEEMLSAAMLDEVTDSLGVATTGEPGLGPTFQLKIAVAADSSREELKKIAAGLGITVADSSWASETPMVSQLSEFQAVAFMQALSAQGITTTVEVKRPSLTPSEEDLALGDLFQVPEGASIVGGGAPSVRLPGSEKGVLLYSGEALPGFSISQTLGIVTAHRSLARRFFRDDEVDLKLKRELERIPGRAASTLPKSRLEVIFRELFLDLQKAALAQAGNAVLGVRIQTFPESNSLDPSLEQMRLVAFGTAAVVEK
jgi:uncharacterized protein YbjQ (UPF0145 family)